MKVLDPWLEHRALAPPWWQVNFIKLNYLLRVELLKEPCCNLTGTLASNGKQIENIKKENKMKKNIGQTDRIIRFVAAILIAVLYFTHVITGTLAIILGIVAVVFLVTSLIGFCPLYTLLGISTNKR